MLKFSRSAALLLACAAALPLAACAGGPKGKGDTSYIARDVNSLYNSAKMTMDRGDYERPLPCLTRSSASTPIRSGLAARS